MAAALTVRHLLRVPIRWVAGAQPPDSVAVLMVRQTPRAKSLKAVTPFRLCPNQTFVERAKIEEKTGTLLSDGFSTWSMVVAQGTHLIFKNVDMHIHML